MLLLCGGTVPTPYSASLSLLAFLPDRAMSRLRPPTARRQPLSVGAVWGLGSEKRRLHRKEDLWSTRERGGEQQHDWRV